MALKFKLGEMRTRMEKIVMMIDSNDSNVNDMALSLIEEMIKDPKANYLELAQISKHFATCLDEKYITHRNTQSVSFIKIRGLIGRWRLEYKLLIKEDNDLTTTTIS